LKDNCDNELLVLYLILSFVIALPAGMTPFLNSKDFSEKKLKSAFIFTIWFCAKIGLAFKKKQKINKIPTFKINISHNNNKV